MEAKYYLRNAITLNATGRKFNAVAMPVSLLEMKKHQHQFGFDFVQQKKDGSLLYKITRADDEDILQGVVSFFKAAGFLYCLNMEVNDFNKKPILLNDGVGKAMVALCCKISVDAGSEGFIQFESKNKLFNYYKRLGAIQIGNSLRFFIDDKGAKKLIETYF